MREYELAVILATPEESEEDAGALYEAGCANGSISTCGGITHRGCLCSVCVVGCIGLGA